ncbi:glycosyltransferase [Marinibacterium sp. SX1]|uniref:glycosyltransferase n=1 Tax=Marinibacterium sp. SX1 TaxID=3388424 RepID=UPI003D184334
MNKTIDLPDGVAQIVVSNGTVLANVSSEVLDNGLGLGIGNDRLRFEPVTEGDEGLPDLMVEFRPRFDPEEMAETLEPADLPVQKLCGVFVNKMKDWALANRNTVQLAFFNSEQPCEIALKAPIRLPAHGAPLTFRAGLAIHRAAGRLILRLRDLKSGKVETRSFAFDPTRIGGHELNKYLQVEHSIPASQSEVEVTLAVAFDSFQGTEPGQTAFFFIADPHVSREVREEDIAGALIFEGTTSPAGDYVWAKAPMPAYLGDQTELALIEGNTVYSLVSGSARRVSVTEDYGHTLIMTASETGTYRFLLDGKFAFNQHLGPDPVPVRVPAPFLDGANHWLVVTDLAGTEQLYADIVLLPRMLTPHDVLKTESSAPFPGPLFAAAGHRYAALRAQLAAGLSAEQQAQVAYCLDVVEGGFENVKLKPLVFPEYDSPDVSIVIPAHNKVEVTYLALASLLLAHNKATFEVILVDDASTDETAELEKIVSGITVIHNAQSQRFIRACNAGADMARGKYVMLLNNDVEVTSGFIDELLGAFDRFPRVGLVGSKLLYPDGRLQDAGGIIWGSGNPWNYGNGQNPWDPRFCYARQADYLTGAAMMTTKEIWDQVGGLSSYLEPMYFEDTDFSFKVREAGYKTYFVPSSIVYHFEGMTSGTDTSSGFKRYQEVNRPKFKRRWAAAYAGFGEQGVKPDLEKDRGITGRVLFIDYATPRPDRDAGSYAAIQEIKLVQSLGYKVTFLPRNLAHLGSYTEELEKMGVEMIYAPFYLSVDEYLEKHARDFDAFFITRFYVARDVIGRLRRLAPQTRILFNNADLHFLRELRAGLANDDPARIEAARQTREIELDVMTQADVVLSYNDTEHAVIQSHTDGGVKVAKCPWVVEMPASVPPRDGRAGLSFLGNYHHHPNTEAVQWFARQVMPMLQPEHPELEFTMYGSAMPDEVKGLANEQIKAEGFVKEISDAYDRHLVFVAPLLSGAGIKGKVLAALAHGVPCVLTPTAAEGIGVRHEHDCMIATSAMEWRDAISALINDPEMWQRMSDNARAYVGHTFSFETGRGLMRQAFEAVDLYSPEL